MSSFGAKCTIVIRLLGSEGWRLWLGLSVSCVLCPWLFEEDKTRTNAGAKGKPEPVSSDFFFFKQWFLILYIHGVGPCFFCEHGKDEDPTLGSSILSILHIFLVFTLVGVLSSVWQNSKEWKYRLLGWLMSHQHHFLGGRRWAGAQSRTELVWEPNSYATSQCDAGCILTSFSHFCLCCKSSWTKWKR